MNTRETPLVSNKNSDYPDITENTYTFLEKSRLDQSIHQNNQKDRLDRTNLQTRPNR